MTDPITLGTVLVYAFEHLHIPAIILGIWKAGNFFSKAEARIEKTISQIDTLATNHFPHMEASLSRQDELLCSMDKSLKTLANQVKRVRRPSTRKSK